MTTVTTAKNQILRMRDVCDLVKLSRATVYEKLSIASVRFDKDFPRPIKLSAGPGNSAIGFLASSIDDWVQGRIEASKTKQKWSFDEFTTGIATEKNWDKSQVDALRLITNSF